MIKIHNGKKLQYFRRSLGLSQYQLAKLTHISRFRISCFESGYIELKKKELSLIQGLINEIVDENNFSKAMNVIQGLSK